MSCKKYPLAKCHGTLEDLVERKRDVTIPPNCFIGSAPGSFIGWATEKKKKIAI